MTFARSENFSKHSENLRELDKNLTQIRRFHKRAIRENDIDAIEAIQKVHFLLVGVRAKDALRKIIADPTGFNDKERKIIWKKKSQIDRWKATVSGAVYRHYQVTSGKNANQAIPGLVISRVHSLLELLEGDLAPIITSRNRLAHGQWIWQLKSGSDDIFRSDQAEFNLNYIEIEARHSILKSISQIVHVFAVSEPTFDRDFDRIYSSIEIAKGDLTGQGYDAFAMRLRRSRLNYANDI